MSVVTRHAHLALGVALLASACGDGAVVQQPGAGGAGGSPFEAPPTPWPVTEFPALPEVARDVPDARVELGNLLFYETLLSVDRETACATCHSEFWGMSDALPLAVGNGAGPLAGPGREGPNTLSRNSPALFNLAFRESLFWDGRTISLEDQALMPLLEADELALDPEVAAAELMAIPEYVTRFAEAFPDDPRITPENLGAALAAFERTFVSNRSIYDAYVGGDAEAMTEEEIDGMFRFAEMGCSDCHTPPLFESETFANRGISGTDGVIDEGRAEVTGRAEDIGAFRTPSLRNAPDTKPYFHDGSVEKLEDAVVHELEQSGMDFGDDDVTLITLFLDKALRDDSRQAERPQSVPSGLPTPLDGPVFPGR